MPKTLRQALVAWAAPLCLWLPGLPVGMAQQVPATKPGPSATDVGAAPASASACAACHGARGEGQAAFPRLAGTGAAYLRGQLDAFASGARQNPVMQPIAQGLAPEERARLASYYAGLPKPRAAEDREARRPADRGAWLATRGRWSDELPACAQCHGPGGRGVGASFPPLAGQPAAYIAQQLRAWQAGTRQPGPLDLMRVIARKLNDEDLRAVSEYYAGLGAAAPRPPVGKKGEVP